MTLIDFDLVIQGAFIIIACIIRTFAMKSGGFTINLDGPLLVPIQCLDTVHSIQNWTIQFILDGTLHRYGHSLSLFY